MGHAIHYCTGCSIQLRDPDFEKGAAFRSEARVYCRNCVPEAVRLRPQAPPPASGRTGEGTSRIPRITPPPNPIRREPGPPSSFPKWILAAGGAAVVIGLVLAMASSEQDPVRAPAEEAPPVADSPPAPAPVPPPVNEKPAEDAIRKAREFAQSHPGDLAGQLALYDAAVRAAEGTGHAAAAAREREALVDRQSALVKAKLEAVDAAVRAACDREEFGAALKRLEEARADPPGSEWPAEIDRRVRSVAESVDKLFVTVRKDAAEARRRGAEDEVRRLADRVARWELEGFKSELAKAVAAATPKKPVSPPPPPKPLDVYRKQWGEAMAGGTFRDFAGALKKLEEVKAAASDPAVQAEVAADLDFLRLAMSAEEEAIQLIARTPKGTKLTLTCITEAGKVEITGTVVRGDAHEIELAREKGSVRIPLGEVASRSLGQAIRGKRDGEGAAVLCILDGDPEGAKGLVEGLASVPEKYWSFKAPPNPPGQAAARRMFYAAEREIGEHARSADALQKYAMLLKDYGTTEFVRRNRALIAARAEGSREFFYVFEDLRLGGAFRAFKGEKDDAYWKTLTESDPAKPGSNFVEIGFSALIETEYRCWFYVGGCCTESASCSYQASEAAEPGGETTLGVKQLPSMPYRTHEAHAGRGRPAPRWGWIQITLPKFSTAGAKRVRLLPADKGFCVSQALVSATRASAPTAGEAKELERARLESRGGRSDPSLVAHWKLADGSGTVAVDSGPFGLDAAFVKGASWAPAALSPPSPPALKLEAGYADLGGSSLLQGASCLTVAAWIHPEKLAGDPNHNVIITLSKHTGGAATKESRLNFSLLNSGQFTVGIRSTDSEPLQHMKSTEKVLRTGVWSHVAGVVDLPTHSITLYLNGAPVPATGAVKFARKSFPSTPSSFGRIGAEDDGSRYYFNGRLSDLRIYTRLLSPDEIAELAAPDQSLR